jgi:hydrophobic/amphiphilic exporter-1 (mainly G- bacteria), HAE1 family
MIMDFAMSAEREQNPPLEVAIYQACVLRFRPIMHDDDDVHDSGWLTADVCRRTGSKLRQPLGFAMAGGLLLSQALALFTTPVVYLYLDRLSNWRKPRRTGPAPSAAGT